MNIVWAPTELKTELPTLVCDFCRDNANIEEWDHSKDEEDDTCIEITPAAEKNVKYKDLHTVYNKHNKQSGTAASKQNNSESTPKVTNVENNQTQ